MKIIKIINKTTIFIFDQCLCLLSKTYTLFKFALNGVHLKSDFQSRGIPIVRIGINAECSFGYQFQINNGMRFNIIGRQQPCIFVVAYKGVLQIGNNVGMSATSIVCWNSITIEDGVRIGGGTAIYDTDFHSLNFNERIVDPEIDDNIKTAPILIKKNAFIGTNCTILKGGTIGENSIIGACSVVTKNIPDNEIWAGNPARFIKKLE